MINEMTILYSTGCPKCKILIKKLDMAHIDYIIIDDKQTMIDKDFTTVPMLEVDKTIMDFKTAVDWINSTSASIEAGRVN